LVIIWQAEFGPGKAGSRMNLPRMAQTEHLGVIFTFCFLGFIEF
jgi:hypothetical protein